MGLRNSSNWTLAFMWFVVMLIILDDDMPREGGPQPAPAPTTAPINSSIELR